MSKEQTPITAEGYLKNSSFTTDILCSKETSLYFSKHLEQYAQYRERKAVLEALEIIVDKLNELEQDARQKTSESNVSIRGVKSIGYNLQYSLLEKQWIFFNNYIQTEVKPKYNPEN